MTFGICLQLASWSLVINPKGVHIVKKKIIVSLGISISLLCIVYILKSLDFSKAKEAFAQANYIYIIPAFFVYISSFLFRAWRWKYLLEHKKIVPIKNLLSVLMIGFMANQILPARLGEVARGFERLWDALTLLLFLSIIMLIFPTSALFKKINFIGALIFVSMLLFIILLTFKKEKSLKLLKRILFFLPEKIMHKILNIIDLFIEGFRVLKKKRHLFLVTLTSICVWLVEIAAYFILSKCFHLQVPIYGIALVLILMNVGVMIPSSPGYVGTFEVFCIMGLGFFGVGEATAFAYAIILHAMMSIPIIILGLTFLWKEGMHLSDIQKSQDN